ncbi:helicase-exonuclease AddAB subunit AddB [Clostridium polynesiense]|uniref:helicase-exonuclease AddAB subunit AddB n=1 Tax=Clostridium polynesiense TaxID=1325933 RepID=UPI00058CAB68|nr:helicase-exonuclease AddAB subunit AddB [Clostridium polynesiense]
MSLRFIFGRGGSGKSQYCLDQIKKRIDEGTKNKLILLVPEQFSFTAEKNLLDAVGELSILKAEVLSFKRMAHNVFSEVGGATHKRMNDAGKSMLLYKIIEDSKEDMEIFYNASRQQGFVDIINEAVKEFKKYNITPEMLEVASSDFNDKNDLHKKLKDLSLLYSRFEKKINERFLDPEDELTLLAEKLQGCSIYNGAEIWIDEFTSFTPQQYAVIEKLLKCASAVNVTLLSDSLSLYDIHDTTDIFNVTKNTERRIVELAERTNTGYLKPVDLNGDCCPRFNHSDEIQHLEKHFFSFPYSYYNNEAESLRLYKAQNSYEELEFIARDIIRLTRDEGYRFKDIAVVCRNLDSYEKLTSVIFREYDIPYFMDKKIDIMDNPLVVLINSMFDIFMKNWSYEAVFRYLKTGLTGIPAEEIDILENYVLANGIRGSKWMEDMWGYRLTYGFKEEAMTLYESSMINRVNETREAVVKPLLDIHEKIKSKATVRELSVAIYDYIVKIGALERMEQWRDKFSSSGMQENVSEYDQVIDFIMGVLDQLVETMGDEYIKLEEFSKILNVGFLKCEIGLIPISLDQVNVGDIGRIKSQGVKALYIIGVNDGVFPKADKEEGILSDNDRITLKERGIELAADTKTKAFEEQLLVYTALTMASRYLMMTFPMSDFEGKALRPSIVISRAKKIFPKLIEESDIVKKNIKYPELEKISSPQPTFNELIGALRRDYEGEEIEEVWRQAQSWYEGREPWREKSHRIIEALTYSNQVESINSEKIRKLYEKPYYFSVSRLEQYSECPFAYFVKYGLKAKDRKIYELSSPDLGSFMHEVLDDFSRHIENEGKQWKDLNSEYSRKIISSIVDEMLANKENSILNSSAKYKYIGSRVKRILTKSVNIISEQIKRGSFKPLGYEMTFGKGKEDDMPAIRLELPSGEEIFLRGRIDRVDTMEMDGNTYIRIIDYKSGSKELDLSDIYYGLQIQLLIYLEALISNSEKFIKQQSIPGAILYFRIDDPIVKGKPGMSEEEIKEQIMKRLKMKGLLLGDAKVIKEMDKTMTGYSLIIPAKLNKDDSLSKSSSAITEEQFEILRNYVRESLVKLCDEMLKGNIKIKPAKKLKYTACQNCSYASVCQFDTSMKDNSYNYMHKKKDEDVWELMKEKIQEELKEERNSGN